ncbi:unnamed protein product [Zymoseptoria tritici ST99CH_1A5]|uniref:ADF-H domain-containing protein n=1 Tax=Zymoseptoria tritici ST99CH_1A5 TaxID=1276529 RepID=A0A1Y6LB88_ZYMTR|nr:unnamed protein product [Zymoseptoria tritici ST99CH_1A5]
MSLSGLDSSEVQAAYNTAVAEPAGWFLLKYKTRDAIELLAQGRGGVSEARSAISGYTDKSPLYGLLMYRRRRILVKYIPEGTSRLLQARTNVHLQDVLERYSPYETLLEIPAADALSDTSLAQSFPLHTAAASPAPSGGRLDEIHEDEDEEEKGGAQEAPSSERLLSPQRPRPGRRGDNLSARAERAERLASSLHAGRVSTPTSMNPLASPLSKSTTPATTQEQKDSEENKTPQEAATLKVQTDEDASAARDTISASATSDLPVLASPEDEAPPPPPKDVPSATASATQETKPLAKAALSKEATEFGRPSEDTVRLSTDRARFPDRTSSMAARPFSADEDPYDLSKYDELFKPKVKLGPRPVSTVEKAKRGARVSAIPASFKSVLKKSESERPASQASMVLPPRASSMAPPPRTTTASSAPTLSSHTPPPVPITPDFDPRPISRSSVKSSASHRSLGMTTDKLRLMKALDFRKRQMRKSQQQSNDSEPMIDATAPEVPPMPATATETTESRPPEGGIADQGTADGSQRETTANHNHTLSSKADSGIELRYEPSEDARTEVESIAEGEDESKLVDEQTAEPASAEPVNTQLDEEGHADIPVEPETSVEEASASSAEAKTVVEEPSDAAPVANDGASIPDSQEEHVMENSWLNISGEDIKEDRRMIPAEDQLLDTEDQALAASPEPSESTEETRISVPAITMQAASRPVTSNGDTSAGASTFEPVAPASIRSSVSSITDDGRITRPNSAEVAKGRRRGMVEPLITSGDSTPRDDFMSDDEFLEELHSATIVEARPVTVARSPITPLSGGFNFSNQGNIDDSCSVRSVSIYRSSSYRKMGDEGDQVSSEPPRSASAAKRLSATSSLEKHDLTARLTRNVSSGISRRIQALNEFNSREPSPVYTGQASPLTPETSPNAFLHQDSKDRSLPRRMLSKRRLSRQNAGSHTPPSPMEGAPVWNVQHDPVTNSNSVSVTARIVRPEQVPDENSALQQSDLSFAPRDSASYQSLPELPQAINTGIAQSATSTPPLSPAATTHSGEYRTLHSASGRFSRRRKTASSEDAGAVGRHSRNTSSAGTLNEDNAAPSIKEGNMASRFFKRVSTLGGPKSRKSVAPSVTSSMSGQGTTISERAEADTSDTPPGVVVGDLNVQFPDSLLWKRRIVSIDDHGALSFSPTQGSTRTNSHVARQSIASSVDTPIMTPGGGIAAKRFPLADFKSPTTPDLERQELPHSVVLEFPDGTTLQLACEDAMTQRQVLHLLRSYWKSWGAVM